MKRTPEEIIRKYWQALNDRDWATFTDLLADQVQYHLPQTREMVRGRSALKSFNQNYPGSWTLALTTLVTSEDQGASIIRFLDNDSEQTGVSFFELEDGRIKTITEYWPVPYQPPPRNVEGVERY